MASVQQSRVVCCEFMPEPCYNCANLIARPNKDRWRIVKWQSPFLPSRYTATMFAGLGAAGLGLTMAKMGTFGIVMGALMGASFAVLAMMLYEMILGSI